MQNYTPATQPTMYFIGVTTGKSSINKVFKAWAKPLGIEGVLRGIDFAPNSDPKLYRDAVEFIKDDPMSLGALITTHKINLLRASKDLFEELDPFAQTLDEISSISKREGKLVGHAMDPITVGVGLDAIVPATHWSNTGGHALIIGSGGASLALTLNLHNRMLANADVPSKLIVAGRNPESLEEMRELHSRISFKIPVEYVLTPDAQSVDHCINALPPHSVIINATGMGKDIPGSPTTDAVVYPEHSIVWEFNYRGDLLFLEQANAQAAKRNLTVEDGWVYFVFSWTRVIAQVFDIDIPTSGPVFDELSRLAREATK